MEGVSYAPSWEGQTEIGHVNDKLAFNHRIFILTVRKQFILPYFIIACSGRAKALLAFF